MARDARVRVDLPVVAALEGLVAEEVDGAVRDAAGLLRLGLEVAQAVRLVPARGEHVEGELAADGISVCGECQPGSFLSLSLSISLFEGWSGKGKKDVRQIQMSKSLLQLLNKRGPDAVLEVVLLEGEALLEVRVAADGRDVDHAVAELDEGAALDGDVEVGDVVQDEVDELLVLGVADPLDEARARQRLAQLPGRQPVLAEAEVEHARHGAVGGAQLLLLLREVRAAHVPDRHLLPERRERRQHVGRRGAAG